MATLADLIALADHPKFVGIGETGLDYYYDNSERETQRDLFRGAVLRAHQPPRCRAILDKTTT